MYVYLYDMANFRLTSSKEDFYIMNVTRFVQAYKFSWRRVNKVSISTSHTNGRGFCFISGECIGETRASGALTENIWLHVIIEPACPALLASNITVLCYNKILQGGSWHRHFEMKVVVQQQLLMRCLDSLSTHIFLKNIQVGHGSGKRFIK